MGVFLGSVPLSPAAVNTRWLDTAASFGFVQQYRHPLRALTMVGLTVIAYVAVGKTVGFGALSHGSVAVGEVSEWCERVHDGLLREPVNTFSNVGFVVAGVAILVTVARDAPPRESCQFVGNTSHALLYGYVTVFLGPASAAMHGTNTKWAWWLDVLSMVAYIWVAPIYNLAAIGRWQISTGFLLYAAIVLIFAVVSWFLGTRLGTSLDLFEMAIIIWGATELLHRFPAVWVRALSGLLGMGVIGLLGLRPSNVGRNPLRYWWLLLVWVPALAARGRPENRRTYLPWAIMGVCSFGTGFAVWEIGKESHQWCRPDSVLQAHGIWHFLCAMAAYFFFRFLRTEQPRGTTSVVDRRGWGQLDFGCRRQVMCLC